MSHHRTLPDVTAGKTARVLPDSWRPHTKGTLLGFFSAELPSGLVLHGLTAHEKCGKRWIGLPARSYVDKDGKTSWNPLVEVPDSRKRYALQDLLLAAVEPYLQAPTAPEEASDADCPF